MEQNKFFRIVWRFNALLLALGGLLLVALAGWNLFFSPWFRTTPQGHFAPVPKSAEKDHTYRLARLQLTLNREAIFQLGRWDGAPNKYGLQDVELSRSSEYGGPDTVNLLAVDGASGSGHWLFHGFYREVISEDTITKPGTPAFPAVADATGMAATSGNDAIALVVHTIDADTDKDGALTDKDRQSLYVYRPGSSFATKLIDVDYLLSSSRSGNSQYLVVYERGKTAYAAVFSLPDFKLLSEKAVPPVPN